jgi:lysozyme family protein
MMNFESLKSEYRQLWDSMAVLPGRQSAVNRIADKLMANRERYVRTQKATGVPWAVIATWHNRESNANFNTQLAQGDPLGHVSTHVPAGRGPFDSWEDGAHDALVTLKHLDRVIDWSPERICYETERYNGFGYRNHHPNVLSPYLWSFSTHYSRGKYVADGRFDSDAVDQQCGAIPLIKRLMELDGQIGRPSVPVPPKTGAGAAAGTAAASGGIIAAIAHQLGAEPGVIIGILVAAAILGFVAYKIIQSRR